MQRVLIVGSPGAGKSTLAKELAARTGLPLTHLDELYWDRGWTKVERPLWLARLSGALAGERWIVDGNFASSLVRRAYRADTVVFLRVPRALYLWRAFWRGGLGRHPHGECRPHWPPRELLLDIWRFPAQAEWQLAQLRTVPGVRLVVLETPGQVRAFLERVE